MSKVKVIAFYLPQFYPTPENDEWWQPGFTEWTNVAKAKPLFRGHHQPRLPQELSFYDLRVPEVREKQAQLARIAGIDGFCYWHYWFGNGKRLLSEVFQQVVESGHPDFPFCLCWANHSWFQKTWDSNKSDRLLMEQSYPGEEDYVDHFNAMLPAFMDKRYMRTEDDRLIFGIFSPYDSPQLNIFMQVWNRLAKENGLSGFEFFAFIQGHRQLKEFYQAGIKYDRIVYDALKDAYLSSFRSIPKMLRKVFRIMVGLPRKMVEYKYYVDIACNRFSQLPDVTPCIDPTFDHSPRSGKNGIILLNDSPQLWGRLCRRVKELLSSRECNQEYLFIKAWNEWGEGNYLEPDQRNGRAYIYETGRIFNQSDSLQMKTEH